VEEEENFELVCRFSAKVLGSGVAPIAYSQIPVCLLHDLVVDLFVLSEDLLEAVQRSLVWL
jgi:hypothetical protein